MTSEQQLADHWLKRNETLNAFILFEGGALSQEMLQIIMEHYKYRRISLYQLPDLKKVAAYGPWLVCIESEKDLAMVLVGKLPVAGIVFRAAAGATGLPACCGVHGKNARWS